MNTLKKILISVAATALACTGAFAQGQEGGFDLSSQRGETSDVLPVPGKKIDHKGIVVSPTPHEMSVDREHWLDISGGFELKCRQWTEGEAGEALSTVALDKALNRDDAGVEDTPGTAAGRKVKLTVEFGPKAAGKEGVKEVSGAYVLSVGKEGVKITGYDDRGAFYGLQTLRQLVESPVAGTAAYDGGAGKSLPYARINDWPDLPNRGVIEGFYGTPWSHETRLALIDFCGRFKANVYMYGPKDDPYHRSPYWREPYPEKEAQDIRELVEACRRNRVDFVWAAHPGEDIRWDEEDYGNLINKFNCMYDLGVRCFGIYFDDIDGEGINPHKQVELMNRITDDFIRPKGDVSPLIVCPTDYSRLWANPGPRGALAIYGESLYPEIDVFWTGDVVCSDLTRETLNFINGRIRRPAYYWWNFPVTDYAREIVMQGPSYGLDPTLTARELNGLVSNPMEYGQASKLAIYGVADYTWNIVDYNPMDNWERGLAELMPGCTEAYREFAIHSCDTETGYRRAESWETKTFRLDDWTDEDALALEEEFKRIEKVPGEIEAGCADRALFEELRPWLEEFGKLGTRGWKTIELARTFRERTAPSGEFWNEYVKLLPSSEEEESYNAHKSGTMKLRPFVDNALDDMAFELMERLTGEMPRQYVGFSSFANSRTTLSKLMLDGDSTTFYTSAEALKACDGNPQTYYDLSGTLSFAVGDGTEEYILLMNSLPAPLRCTCSDAGGNVLSEVLLTEPFSRITLTDDSARITLSGDVEIFEVIPLKSRE